MALSGVNDHKETAALGGKVLGLAYRLGEDAIEFNFRLNYFIRKIVFKVHQELTDGDIVHLCFEQAQPKMYHSPKVDDGVDVFLKIS